MAKLFILLFMISFCLYGQNVRISDTPGTPHNSAGLEVDYISRGVLVPRMTQTERDAISSPAHSLLIFNITSNCYEWWDNTGNRWVTLSCGDCTNQPGLPTAITATDVTENSFTANWNPVGTATYYRLEVATDMAFTNPLPGFNNLNVGNVTSFDVPGHNCCVTLSCNTTYYYRVKACNPCGCSNVSNVITVTTLNTTPSAPTATAATSITATSFTANWNAVSGATSYRLDVATDAGFTSFVTGYNDLNVGNVTNYSVTGLNCNTTYYYRVRACNACGCSGNSNTINLTTLNSTPSAPTANAATSITSTSFTANWSSSTGATSYRLDVATDAAFTNMVTGYNDLNVGNVTSYNVTGLTCNTTYYYRVRACNSCGCSGNSNTINLTTNACAETNACQFFGGSNHDSIYAAIVDGTNYVMGGSTNSWGAGGRDGWIVRLATDLSYSSALYRAVGTALGDETITKIKKTSYGGYILIGNTNVSGNIDAYVVKLDGTFALQWSRRYGGTGTEYGTDIAEVGTNEYIFVGNTNSAGAGGYDLMIMRINSTGGIVWQKTYGGPGNESGNALVINNNGDAAVAGFATVGMGNIDGLLVVFDVATGNVLLQRTVGAATGPEMFFSLLQDTDNGYVMAGFIASQPENNYTVSGYENAYIVKLDETGSLVFARSVGEGLTSQRLYSIIKANDGGFIGGGIHGVMGYVTPSFQEAYYCKLNSSGAVTWQSIKGSGNHPNMIPDMTYQVLQASSGEIVSPVNSDFTAGYGQVDLWMYQFKSDGTGGCCSTTSMMGSTTGGNVNTPSITSLTSSLANNAVTTTVTSIIVPMQIPFPCAVPVRVAPDFNSDIRD